MTRTELPNQCAHCGDRLDEGGWHPLKTTSGQDGEVQIHSFCDDTCLEAWEEGHSSY